MRSLLLIVLMLIGMPQAKADVTRSASQERIHAAREAHHQAVMKVKKEELEPVTVGASSKVVITRNPQKKKVVLKESAPPEEDKITLKTKEECAVMKDVKEKEACYKTLSLDKKKEIKESPKVTTTK